LVFSKLFQVHEDKAELQLLLNDLARPMVTVKL